MPPAFELSLTVTVVGTNRCGSSTLVQQLLHPVALGDCLDPARAKDNDDAPVHSQEAAAASEADEKAEKRLLPKASSHGINFKTGDLHVDSDLLVSRGARAPISVLFHFNFLDVGGASCSPGLYRNPDVIASAVCKADVVLAVYDYSDKNSLQEIVDSVLPVVFSAGEATAAAAAGAGAASNNGKKASTVGARTILLVGTKADKKKKVSAEEQKKTFVTGAQQKQVEQQLSDMSSAARKANVKAILVNSVSPVTGAGLPRLRREILHCALRARKVQLQSVVVFDDPQHPQSLWLALSGEALMLEKSVNIVAASDSAAQQGKSDAPPSASLDALNKSSAGSGGGKEDEDPGQAPVLDVSSNAEKTKKKKGENGEEGDPKETGVSCKLCGCVVQ